MFDFKFDNIYAGYTCTYAVKDDYIYSTGSNVHGELGLGVFEPNHTTIFKQIKKSFNVKKIALGVYTTYILTDCNELYVCGDNINGQLCMNDKTTRFRLTKCDIDNIKDIFPSGYCCFILKNDGTVWACGYNYQGNLGLGNRNTAYTVTKVNIDNVKQISCGDSHTFILKNDGSLWSSGFNHRGQLGLGDTTNRTTFTQVTTNINNDVKEVICGNGHTFILKNDGSIWSCGYNNYGQLGLGNTTQKYTFTQVTTNINNDVKEVVCGNYCTFILKNDCSVWACGQNNVGQLGLGNQINRSTFTKVTTNINNDVKQVAGGWYHTFIIKNDGNVWSCGYNNNGQLSLPISNKYRTFTKSKMNDIKKVYVADSGVYVLNNNNEVYYTGSNYSLQCGIADYEYVCSFTKIAEDVEEMYIGYYHNMMKKTNGEIYAAGANWGGQLGINNTDGNETEIFTKIVGEFTDVKRVYCYEEMSFLLLNNGDLYSCGDSTYGQLGLGDNENRYVFTKVNISDVKDVSLGYCHAVILKNDGTVWSCGYNNYGQLGLGDYTNRNTFTQLNVSGVSHIFTGDEFTMLLTESGDVYGCGNNEYGQLGLSNHPVKTITKVASNVKKMFNSQRTTFLLKNDNTIWVAGWNGYGQLGLNSSENIIKTFTNTNLNLDIKDISLSDRTSFILCNNRDCYFAGLNVYGGLGCSPLQAGDQISFNTFTKYLNNTSFSNVDVNIEGEIVHIDKANVGLSHELLKSDDAIYISGSNEYGQLGLGDNEDRISSIKVDVPEGVKDASCGDIHTVLLDNNGNLKVAGSNINGELGLGDSVNTVNSFTVIEHDISHAKAKKGLTIIKKNGKYYVTGEYKGKEFTEHTFTK